MVPAPFIVVVDANVLFLDEMERNLVATGTMPADKAARLRGQMEKFFPEAMVTSYEPLIAVMPNDAKDRHVVAGAVKAGAQVIATANLKDFTPSLTGSRRSHRTSSFAICSTSTPRASSSCSMSRHPTCISRP